MQDHAHGAAPVCGEMSTYALQLKNQLTVRALEIIGFGSVVVDCYPGEVIRSKLAWCLSISKRDLNTKETNTKASEPC